MLLDSDPLVQALVGLWAESHDALRRAERVPTQAAHQQKAWHDAGELWYVEAQARYQRAKDEWKQATPQDYNHYGAIAHRIETLLASYRQLRVTVDALFAPVHQAYEARHPWDEISPRAKTLQQAWHERPLGAPAALIRDTSTYLQTLQHLHNMVPATRLAPAPHFRYPNPWGTVQQRSAADNALRRVIRKTAASLIQAELTALFGPEIERWSGELSISREQLHETLETLRTMLDRLQQIRSHQWPSDAFNEAHRTFYRVIQKYQNSSLHGLAEAVPITPAILSFWERSEWPSEIRWEVCFRACDALDRRWTGVVASIRRHANDWETYCESFSDPNLPNVIHTLIEASEGQHDNFRHHIAALLAPHTTAADRAALARDASKYVTSLAALVLTYYADAQAAALWRTQATTSAATVHGGGDPPNGATVGSSTGPKDWVAWVSEVLQHPPVILGDRARQAAVERYAAWRYSIAHHRFTPPAGGWWTPVADPLFQQWGWRTIGIWPAYDGPWARIELVTDTDTYVFPIGLDTQVALDDNRMLLAITWILSWIASVQRDGVMFTVDDFSNATNYQILKRALPTHRTRSIRSFRSYQQRLRLRNSSRTSRRRVRPHPVRGHLHWERAGYVAKPERHAMAARFNKTIPVGFTFVPPYWTGRRHVTTQDRIWVTIKWPTDVELLEWRRLFGTADTLSDQTSA